jgi:hypothetical protein
VYSELLPYVLKPYAGNIEFANAPYVIVQSEDGSISIKRKSETSKEQDELMQNLADEGGIAQESYETIGTDRHLTPATFYGMEIEYDSYKKLSYKQDNGNTVRFGYKVMSSTN